MNNPNPNRRSYGTASLFTRTDAGGRQTWYGKWRANGRQVKRRIGPKRESGAREGLTRTQAEAELRQLIGTTQVKPRAGAGEGLTIGEVAARYIAHAERRGRKPSTLANIESEARVHLEPFFGARSLDRIEAADVLDLIATLEGKGRASKTIRNVVATLSALFNSPGRRSADGRARIPARAWNCPRSPSRRRFVSSRLRKWTRLSPTRAPACIRLSIGRCSSPPR